MITTINLHSKIKKCGYKLNELLCGESSDLRNGYARFLTKLNGLAAKMASHDSPTVKLAT